MGGLVCEMLFAPLRRLHSRWENQAASVAVAAAIKMIVNTMTARRILAVVARTPEEMQTPTEIEPASDAASADCAMRAMLNRIRPLGLTPSLP